MYLDYSLLLISYKVIQFCIFIINYINFNAFFYICFRDKIVDLEKKRKDLNKHRNRLSTNLVLKREQFSRMLEEVFDVSQKNCEGIIMKDKTKDIKTRREDADFLNGQKGARVQKILGRDTMPGLWHREFII